MYRYDEDHGDQEITTDNAAAINESQKPWPGDQFTLPRRVTLGD